METLLTARAGKPEFLAAVDTARPGDEAARDARRAVVQNSEASAAEYQTARTFPISIEHFFVFLFSQKEGPQRRT